MSEIITCPTGLSGRIRGMKVREERVLADRRLAKSGGQVDELLAACWEVSCPAVPSRRRVARRCLSSRWNSATTSARRFIGVLPSKIRPLRPKTFAKYSASSSVNVANCVKISAFSPLATTSSQIRRNLITPKLVVRAVSHDKIADIVFKKVGR